MTVLTHAVYALAYLIAGISAGAALWALRPEADPLVSWLAGALVVLGGALAHDVVTRLERERRAARRAARLHDRVEELARLLEQRVAADAAAPASGGDRYDAVMQEVRLLQSLVARLTERRTPRPPASGSSRQPAGGSGDAVLTLRTPAPPPDGPEPMAAEPPLAGPMDDAAVLEAVRDALRADRIDVYLQPIVSLPQRKHRFYEVYSRVRSVDGQQIMPDRYLEIAEREGLIATIDNLLLVRCIQLIRETERRQHAIGFFSNISAATLADAEFMRHFLTMMGQNQALVPKLVFELSQHDLQAGGAVTMGILSQLARLGFRFSMDQVSDLDLDLQRLLRHEFRFVKLDRALVLDPANAPRIQDLRRRCATEGVDLIVEKIETEGQLVEVLDIGFDFGQGYLFGEPRPSRKPG
ncbi:EAL domain-containing protein [Azospirillum picis]|uniref:Cyclic-di-GMP phosphodiesterase TipF (Flagellum assembly factor) n=1 Tax=Azospirillum picis TaxID=488438 RepID=A0ABU0MQG3_9PROT|nr:EAL domain-containing protein [Azospirillum picis]MBP2301596.1 cyclic-di-GMP phosphodiesterase TipF (flagellum assembly factor) [Azospirillum picis]MDQ0535428.1 cyclic-di-GMP phosphodiesterase TipF (flagellum assembly factor) [Azospirillum picis]